MKRKSIKTTSFKFGRQLHHASDTSPDEFHQMLRFSDQEWEGILRFGRHCGLRLKDCARLKNRNLSRDRKTLNFTVPNRKRPLKFPLGPKLRFFLSSLVPTGSAPDAPLFPRSIQLTQNVLEAKFTFLAAQAGLVSSGDKFAFSSLYFKCARRSVAY